jgi:ribose transport system substrate-binding protein
VKYRVDRRTFLLQSLFLSATAAIPGYAQLLNALPTPTLSKRLRAAMMNNGLKVSWDAQGKIAAEQFGRWLGVDIVWYDGQLDLAVQRQNMEDIAQQDWDFVAVQPGSIGILVTATEKLTQKGIPVIDMDTLIAPFPKLAEMGVLTFIAPDNVAMAENVVQVLVDRMNGTGKIAHTWGGQGHTGAQGRAQGFYNVLARYPNIEVVDDQPADWDVDRTMEIWDILLDRHPDLKAGFLHNDDMALAARQVVEKKGMQGQVVLGGVDGMIPAIRSVMDAKLLATVRNSSPRIHGWAVLAGYYAAVMGLAQARKDIPNLIIVDGPLITLENLQADPKLSNEPWKMRGYGQNNLESQIWAQTQLVF